MASEMATIKIHLTGEDIAKALEEAVARDLRELRAEVAALRDGLDAWAGRIQVLEERLDHMQDRLDRQGARLRHLEALPGVAEALAATKETAE